MVCAKQEPKLTTLEGWLMGKGKAGMGKSRLLYEFRKAVGNEDVTFLEVGFDVLLVHGNGSVKSFKCFIILGDLGQGTSFVEKDGHVKSIVQVVEFQTLLIQGQCLLDVALPETVSCVILRLLGFRHVFPELHILRRVGVD